MRDSCYQLFIFMAFIFNISSKLLILCFEVLFRTRFLSDGRLVIFGHLDDCMLFQNLFFKKLWELTLGLSSWMLRIVFSPSTFSHFYHKLFASLV
jgi:hypothetical protein